MKIIKKFSLNFGKQIKEDFFIYQMLDVETSLSEKKRIIATLGGTLCDDNETVNIAGKELLEITIKPKNRKESQREEVVLKYKDNAAETSYKEICYFEIKVSEITYFKI